MRGDHPVWNDQTTEQKLAFVHEWLMNVEVAIRDLRGDIRGLTESLRRVEAVNAQPPKPKKPGRR